jgi:hypothetical protein
MGQHFLTRKGEFAAAYHLELFALFEKVLLPVFTTLGAELTIKVSLFVLCNFV